MKRCWHTSIEQQSQSTPHTRCSSATLCRGADITIKQQSHSTPHTRCSGATLCCSILHTKYRKTEKEKADITACTGERKRKKTQLPGERKRKKTQWRRRKKKKVDTTGEEREKESRHSHTMITRYSYSLLQFDTDARRRKASYGIPPYKS